MEDLEMKHELRRYVTSAEPPFSLTASGLLTMGRRQRRWRFGMSVGAGSAATAVAIVGTMNLVPLGNRLPALDVGRCEVPLAANWSPMPSHYPSDPGPSPEVTPWPTQEATPSPGDDPSPPPTNEPTPWPTNEPTPWPTNEPTPWPTGEATPWPTDHPNPWPSEEATPWPTERPTAESAAKAEAASCYLAEQFKAMLPHATYAAPYEVPPLSLSGGDYGYVGGAIVIDKGQSIQLIFNISPIGETPGESQSPGIQYLHTDQGMTSIRAHTEKSVICISATGSLLRAEQLTGLATAPELDIFR